MGNQLARWSAPRWKGFDARRAVGFGKRLVFKAVTAPGLPEASRPAGAGAFELSRPLRRRMRPSARWLVMLVPAAFILTYLWLIWTQTPTAPYWDEWIYVPLVKHANQGTLSLQEIWALHWFSHRIVIPRLVDLALIQLTSWNRQIMMTFDLGVGVASAALIFSCARDTLKSDRATLILVAPMSLLLFSFSQAHDWLAPFQIAFIATAFGVACCTRALLHRPLTWSRFAFALCGALIATLSSAAGLVAWVAFAPSILRAGYRKLLIWGGVAIGVCTAYLVGYPHVHTAASRKGIPPFVLAYLGAPLGAPSVVRAEIFGAVGLAGMGAAVYLYWRRHGELSAITAWLDLALFALGTDVLTTIGRFFAGTHAALTSTYQIFSALWWIALLVIVGKVVVEYAATPMLWDRLRSRIAIVTLAGAVSGAALMLLCGIVANAAGFTDALAWQGTLTQHQWCIADYRNAPDSCLGLWFPIGDKQQNVENAIYLEAHHLAIFAGAQGPRDATAPPRR